MFKKIRYFKLIRPDGQATHAIKRGGNYFSYAKYLPYANGSPGPWLPEVKGDLVMCRNGYHVMRLGHIHHWAHRGNQDYRLFEVEVLGRGIKAPTKEAFRQIRLLREIYPWYRRVQKYPEPQSDIWEAETMAVWDRQFIRNINRLRRQGKKMSGVVFKQAPRKGSVIRITYRSRRSRGPKKV